MKLLSIIAASIAVLLGPASATIVVLNHDMEHGGELANQSPTYGDWEQGIAGWNHSQGSGTYSAGVFDPTAITYHSTPAEMGTRIAWIAQGASVYQTLNYTIESGTNYSLSALFGHRITGNFTLQGRFGFYAGDVGNIIALTDITDPGEGLWSRQTFSINSAMVAQFVGQQLGIIFFGDGTQLNFDDVQVTKTPDQVPLPAAVWLFGTALAGGGLIARKRKKKTA